MDDGNIQGAFGNTEYTADEKFLKELKSYGMKHVDPSIMPTPSKAPVMDTDGRALAPWEMGERDGEKAMREILGDDYMTITMPEPPRTTIMPGGDRIVPVRAVRRINVRELGSLRRFMEPDQINERMISELMHPLLKELDEMGLIDLQINHINPETLEYSISLNVLKNESR